jgi:F0F1-type ATP synthase delta subunit
MRMGNRMYVTKNDLLIQFESLEDHNTPFLSMVPGLVFGESGKFASYYWIFANKQNALEEVEKDFDKILKLRENEKDFNSAKILIYSNKYEPVERAQAFCDPNVLRISLSPTTQKLISDLCVKDRQYLMWAIIEDYKDLMKAHRKEIDVTIILPKIPTPEYYELLLSKITNEYLSTDSKMTLSIEIDPTISRGYKFRMGNKSVDNTWNSDMLRRTELEDQSFSTIEKNFQSLYPKVYDVKRTPSDENVAYILNLIEKISSEKVVASVKQETSKSVTEIEKSVKSNVVGYDKTIFD